LLERVNQVTELTQQLDSHTASHGDGSIVAALGRLRRHIRRYTWAEGLAAAIAAVAIAFWVSLALDWLFEPPMLVRIALLLVVGAVVFTILFRLILRRALAPLTDRNMAVLLERRFDQLNDSLLTAVELHDAPHGTGVNTELLRVVRQEAAAKLDLLDVDEVLDFQPLRRNMFAAAVSVVSVIVFAAGAPDQFDVWNRRVIQLSNEAWPRRTHLEVEGFEDGRRKVARGSDVEILVRADTNKEVPEVVELRYVTDEGVRGRQLMQREGEAAPGKEPYQLFVYTFEAVPSGRVLEITGGDVRLRDLHLEVVDSPTIVDMTLDFAYPEYTRLSPSKGNDATGAMQVPRGARIALHAVANKPLLGVEIQLTSGDSPDEVREISLASEKEFHFKIDHLDHDRVLLFTLTDTDGLQNSEPLRLALAAMPDGAPQLSIRPQGIGSAITPQARLPFAGKMTDDYGVVELWFEYLIDHGHPRRAPVTLPAQNLTEATIEEAFDVRSLKLQPGRQLEIRLAASDNHDLPPEGPHEGASETFTLDIVTAEELRAILESRELNLRRRFESIIAAVETTNQWLVTFSPESLLPKDKDPADSAEDENKASNDSQHLSSSAKLLSLAMLRVQRAVQDARMNGGETLGIATSFEQIGAELQNNRVPDYEELLSRLNNGIAAPLRGIAEEMLPSFRSELEHLRDALPATPGEEIDLPAIGQALTASVIQSEQTLAEMHRVLDRMLELETFNELVDLLRSIIDSQEQIAEQLKQERKAQLRRLLEE